MKNTKQNQTWYSKALMNIAPRYFVNRQIALNQAAIVMSRSYSGAASSALAIGPKKSETVRSRAKLAPLREDARNLVRENSFASRAVDVITNGTVGWGIEANISGPDTVKQEWTKWTKTCSIDGDDFLTLQSRVMRSVVVDGECVLRVISEDNALKLQLLPADFIDERAQDYSHLKAYAEQGILCDEYSRARYIALYSRHPGDFSNAESKTYELNREALHIFKRERPMQLRGISWLYRVITPLAMLSDLQKTHLNRLVLSSAITAIVKQDISMSNATQTNQLRYEQLGEVNPGSALYLNPGESVETPSIPNPEGFGTATNLALREAAMGLGITFEAISGDLNGVNFSSARIGDIQFRSNIESWRWHTLIPQFLDRSFEVFKRHCEMKGMKMDGVTVVWNPPQRQLLNPMEEVNSTSTAIRNGLQTLPGALRELGIDPKRHLEEIAESNKLVDSLGLIFDSDARRTANGQLQAQANLPENNMALALEESRTQKPS